MILLGTVASEWRDFFEIIVEGGMRLEVLELRWERVDLVDGFINLDTSTKTAKTRDVHIMPVMEEAFARLAARRDRRWPDAEFVFVNPETGRRYRSIWRGWHAIRIEARLHSCRIHDRRHTFSKVSGDAAFEKADLMQHQGPRRKRRSGVTAARRRGSRKRFGARRRRPRSPAARLPRPQPRRAQPNAQSAHGKGSLVVPSARPSTDFSQQFH